MTAFLDGVYTPLDECRVSALDRGFLFGDAVYEVIAVYDNTPFAVDKHLKRLAYSLEQSDITNPYTSDEWQAIFRRLISDEPTHYFGLYVHVSRGICDRDLSAPADLRPSVFAMTMPYAEPSAGAPTALVKVMTMSDLRWGRCDIKVTSLMSNALARCEAHKQGYNDAIMLRDGQVTEATAANIFVVRNNSLYTPPESHFLLAGITREILIEIAGENEVATHEEDFGIDLVYNADEIWLTSSTKEITAVCRVDDRAIGDGTTYPWHAKFSGWLARRTDPNDP